MSAVAQNETPDVTEEGKPWRPDQEVVSTVQNLASKVRSALEGTRVAWLNLSNELIRQRETFTGHGLKSTVFESWAEETTGFAIGTIRDAMVYAATLPTLPEGSDTLDKSWVSSLAKARPQDRAGILKKVEKVKGTDKVPAARAKKAELLRLANESKAKISPLSADQVAAKNERAAKRDNEAIDKAVNEMPDVIRAALVADKGFALIRLAVEYGYQQGATAQGTSLAIQAVEKVHAEKGTAATPEKVAA